MERVERERERGEKEREGARERKKFCVIGA